MYCYADHVANTSCTASHIWCYAAVISSCTSSHIWCYAAVISSCTSSHIWCYAAVILSCTASHIWCYAAVISSCTSSHIWCYAAIISSCTASHIWCYAAVISSCTSSHIWCYAAIISSCTASHIWCYATSEPSTEIAVRSESNEVQMGVLLYVETQRQVWKHAEFKDFERHLVALSEKDAVRKLFTLYRLQKKNGNFSIFFGTSGCQKWAFRWGETHIFKSHQMKTSKIKCFFSRPWWLKLVFRWGETPISTLESCACHRKMIMTLKCPFTKSHKYNVSSFWRENLKIKIGNPSQGAVSTAYLVFPQRYL